MNDLYKMIRIYIYKNEGKTTLKNDHNEDINLPYSGIFYITVIKDNMIQKEDKKQAIYKNKLLGCSCEISLHFKGKKIYTMLLNDAYTKTHHPAGGIIEEIPNDKNIAQIFLSGALRETSEEFFSGTEKELLDYMLNPKRCEYFIHYQCSKLYLNGIIYAHFYYDISYETFKNSIKFYPEFNDAVPVIIPINDVVNVNPTSTSWINKRVPLSKIVV
jgi:hypothetical protein